MCNKLMDETGQTLMEVIVVATVGVLVVGALTFAVLFSLRNAKFSQNQNQATKLAQQGIEWVKTGRDRMVQITGNFQLGGAPVTGWDDADLWLNQISADCIPNCYFNINSSGSLQYLTAAAIIPSNAELINTPTNNFTRVVILSDDSNYASQKTVTVIVTWSDSTGSHESRLTTILRKL